MSISGPRCDKCQYWDGEDQYGAERFIVGTCKRAIPFWEATEWVWEDDDNCHRTLNPEFSDRRFFAQDGSDYNAVVYTTPDFFCADFTAIKEDKL